MDRFQTGVHPDADQISLFLEGAATAQERAQMLDHLAGCAACREVVFLAQAAEAEPVAIPEEMPVIAWWRRGWMPVGMAGAALAFALALVIYMRQPAPVGDRQMARVEAPAAGPVNAPPAEVGQKDQPTVQEDRAGKGAEGVTARPRESAPGVGKGSGGGLGQGVYQTSPPPPALAANEQVMGALRGNMARVEQNMANATPAAVPPPAVMAPAPASAAVADAGSQQQQTLPAAKAAQGGPAATQQYSVDGLTLTGRNLSALEVLHDQGLGGVTGVVTDQSGAAVGGASVSLNGGADKAVREVVTGPDGRFTLGDVPAGKYELRVSARGFNTRLDQVELKDREVAKLEPVLTVGTESETVTVEASNTAIATQQNEVTSANILQEEQLPGGAAPTARVAMGGRMLSLDAAGHLYLSKKPGKSWKKIKPKWTGKASQLAVVPAAEKGGQLFELTTDAGAVWTSEDGKHWRPQADGKR